MSGMSEIVTALVAAGGSIGTAIAFIWNKVERRFKSIETQLKECERREREGTERRAAQLTVIELLWQEVKRLAPDAYILERAKKLLDDLKTLNGAPGAPD